MPIAYQHHYPKPASSPSILLWPPKTDAIATTVAQPALSWPKTTIPAGTPSPSFACLLCQTLLENSRITVHAPSRGRTRFG